MALYNVEFRVFGDWGEGKVLLGRANTTVKKPWWKRWGRVSFDLAHTVQISELGGIPPGSIVVCRVEITEKEKAKKK